MRATWRQRWAMAICQRGISQCNELKGGSLSIGAHELERLAAALEVSARRSDDAACHHMLGTLASALERTKPRT